VLRPERPRVHEQARSVGTDVVLVARHEPTCGPVADRASTWRSMSRRLASLLLVLVALVAAALAAAPAGLARGLPLGPSGLSETRSTHALAPGLRLTRIVRGHTFRGDGYAVSINLAGTRGAALDLARRVRADGFEAASPASAAAPRTTPARGRSAGSCEAARSPRRPRRRRCGTGW
jgi:hypothetical protein